MPDALLIAIRFLTRIPVPPPRHDNARNRGRAALFYPLAGLLVGLTLAGLLWLLSDSPSLLTAVLLLGAWVLLTGALHLDGLADSADAWIGGLGDREKTLTIMKDPSCGPAGVTTLIMLLLVKFSALVLLCEQQVYWAVLLAPATARAAAVALLLTTPYARPGGMGNPVTTHLPPVPAWLTLIPFFCIISIVSWPTSLTASLVCISVFLILRSMMQHRLGGTTGDTCGAMIEIVEAVWLVTIALMPATGIMLPALIRVAAAWTEGLV